MEKSDTIDYRFKLLYAIGTVLVVGGHLDGGSGSGISLFYDWFLPYGFHLGLFMFCSGYFYKDSNDAAPGKYIRKKIKSLIIPMYIYNFAYALVVLVLSGWGFTIGAGINTYKLFREPIMTGHQFMYNLGGWYVVPLFMIMVGNVLVRWLLKKWQGKAKEPILFAVSMLLGILGVSLAIGGKNTGWWLVLVRALYLVPFFGLGIFYRRVLEKRDKLSNTWYFTIVFAIQLVLITLRGEIPVYVPSWCNEFFDGPVMPYLVGFVGVAFWLRIARVLEPVMGRSRVVQTLAGNTYSIMMNQLAGFMVMKGFFALLSLWTPLCQNFDWNRFRTDIWYYYLPWDLPQFGILYLLAGLFLPVGIQKVVNILKRRMQLIRSKTWKG